MMPKNRAKLDATARIINDEAFWSNAAIALQFVEPINKALAQLQSDDASYSTVYQLFNELLRLRVYTSTPELSHNSYKQPRKAKSKPKPVVTVNSNKKRKAKAPAPAPREDNRELHERIVELMRDRWSFVRTPAMGIAFLLDHMKSVADFQGTENFKAIERASKDAAGANILGKRTQEQYKSLLQRFARVKSSWSSSERKMYASYSPFNWWKSQTKTSEFIELPPLALRIVSICTSSAASERMWSQYKYIHSDCRNRLSLATSNKLLFVYVNMDRNNPERTNDVFYLAEPGANDEDPDDYEEPAPPRSQRPDPRSPRTKADFRRDSHNDSILHLVLGTAPSGFCASTRVLLRYPQTATLPRRTRTRVEPFPTDANFLVSNLRLPNRFDNSSPSVGMCRCNC